MNNLVNNLELEIWYYLINLFKLIMERNRLNKNMELFLKITQEIFWLDAIMNLNL